MTLAILCSGQGRQHAGMFALTANEPKAQGLFAHAALLLGGRDPRELVRSGTAAELHGNRTAQILCALQALAATITVWAEVPARTIIAGYSVGEVSAWGVAGLLGLTEALDLVADRASAMDAVTVPGDGLLFVRGLTRTVVDSLCERHGVEVAIVNPGGAFVLGGARIALAALATDAEAVKARTIAEIPVKVASHTSRLATASTRFRARLRRANVSFPPVQSIRLLSGVDARVVANVEEGLDKLAAQISSTVQWAECLQACLESGASRFLELGPGSALSEMLAGMRREVAVRSIDEFRTLEGARKWLRA